MQYIERVPKELFNSDGHYLGRPADYEDRIIQRRLNLVKSFPNFTGTNLALLEIGCGNGASMFGLADCMNRCVGLEITDEHLDLFNKYKAINQITNCEYRIMNIEKESWDEQYDRIISFEVIEHLESEDSLDFYYQSLKSGGLMAITVPNKWWIFETHGAKLPLLPWNRVPFFSWLPRPIHERYANARIYTQKRILDLLTKHGFKILSCEYVTAPMDVLPKGKFKDWIVRTFFDSDTTSIPFMATSIFVMAQKD